MISQKEFVFFGSNHPTKFHPPTKEERDWMVDSFNPTCPFNRFVGNENAVQKFQIAAHTALSRPNHMMRELNFALFGPASAGKTTLIKLYAECVQLPFIEISPKSVKTLNDLFRIIGNVLRENDLELVELEKPNHYILPPCIIFIDEVHALSQTIVDGLLKATEYKDVQLVTEKGAVINTHNVTWAIATTDEGKLFGAFRTRFSAVALKYIPKKDIAKIVKLANPTWEMDVCELVAHYNARIPRKALEFARLMQMYHGRYPEDDWAAIAKKVATNEGIDDYGMGELQLMVLKALGQGPIAKARMPIITGREEEEVEKNIMPWLLSETEDQPAYVTVGPRGFYITQDGLNELNKRNIANKGVEVLCS
jgi:Holliday junction resolvasome RuvABC ATP-dependent DNA helicase subunit